MKLPSLLRSILGPSSYLKIRETKIGRITACLFSSRQIRDNRRWALNHHAPFTLRETERLFESAAGFMYINGVQTGYYFEFGCKGANATSLAWKHFKVFDDITFVVFEDFSEQGKELLSDERQFLFQDRRNPLTEQYFNKVCRKIGIPIHRLSIQSGRFSTTLNDNLKNSLLPKRASVIFIDCDTYYDAKLALVFSKHFMQEGTIVIFHDWSNFNAHPRRGERRAWSEFISEFSEISYTPYVATHDAQCFIITETTKEVSTSL